MLDPIHRIGPSDPPLHCTITLFCGTKRGTGYKACGRQSNPGHPSPRIAILRCSSRCVLIAIATLTRSAGQEELKPTLDKSDPSSRKPAGVCFCRRSTSGLKAIESDQGKRG